jgi:hypothetical protein
VKARLHKKLISWIWRSEAGSCEVVVMWARLLGTSELLKRTAFSFAIPRMTGTGRRRGTAQLAIIVITFFFSFAATFTELFTSTSPSPHPLVSYALLWRNALGMRQFHGQMPHLFSVACCCRSQPRPSRPLRYRTASDPWAAESVPAGS